MTLDAHIVRTLGTFHLDVELHAEPGEVVAVLGPNGAGKTTVFRCLAGLLPLDDGSIDLDGTCLDDPARDVFVPPERRPVAVVFQDYLLFANLTALENVAFGLRARGMAKQEARTRASEWLDRVGLTAHAGHRPRALSGGQAQRVALARALATEPRLLLLDEPLAALDAGTRGDVRRDLRRHLATFDGVRLLVTHDPVDAYALADRVVILESGRVAQSGTLADVTTRPTVALHRRPHRVEPAHRHRRRRRHHDGDRRPVRRLPKPSRGRCSPSSSPTPSRSTSTLPHGSPRNVWSSTVTDIDRRADRVRVRLDGPVPLVAEITPAALDALVLRPGDRIWAAVKATEITTYAA